MKTSQRNVVSLLIAIASLVLIVAGIKAISGLLSPILLSLFIVLVTSPIMSWLKRRGFSGWLAYTIVLFGVISLGLIFLLFLLSPSSSFRMYYLTMLTKSKHNLTTCGSGLMSEA